MKISANWLKDYIKTDLSIEKTAEYLTDIGLEVEGVQQFESVKGSLEGIVVGKILTCNPHPNADKLKITTVDAGGGTPLQIVCGAPNVAAGQTVPVATVGCTLYGADGSAFQIKQAKIRGEVSQGMICSSSELGLNDDHAGILVLEDEKFKTGEKFASYFDLASDEVIEIGLTPNRTDAMSHYGVARDLHAFLSVNDVPSEFQKIENFSMKGEGATDFKIEVEDTALCPRYLGAVIENVKVAESPAWLQNRLKALGLAPINNIVDISNYVLHSLGQPLHTFDADAIKNKTVKVGVCAKDTRFVTLDGVERKLSGSEIMIKDGENNPLCLAGLFGGLNSGVTSATTSVFLESAYFNPVAVRRAAKYHGLNTDASFRFERGVDPEMTGTALDLAIKMICEIAGGTLRAPVLENYPLEIEKAEVVLRYAKLQQILGTAIPKEKVKEILAALELEILTEEENQLTLSVPGYRADVTREIDVIEEVLRIYGYHRIAAPDKIAFSPVHLNLDDQDALEDFWAGNLQSNGFNEVMNNSLRSVKDETSAVKLLNPLSSDLGFMRTSLLDGLLENADYNIKRKNPDIRFFELGKIYHRYETNESDPLAKYEERKQLALLISGREVAENWLHPKSECGFFGLKGYVELLLEKLNLNAEERALEDERFSDALEIVFEGQTLARLGKVSPAYLKDADLNQDCFYAEIEVSMCQELRAAGELKFRAIPKFNKIRRDLALLVDRDVAYADLRKAALKIPSKFLRSVNLFDVYEGKNLPEGKKSYALSFELLNEEKTLEEKDISEVMNVLIKTFRKEFGAELRA